MAVSSLSSLKSLSSPYNAALKFDATFSVLVSPLDVGKRFARLITHALRELLRTRLGVNRAPYDTLGSKKPAMSFEDDLRRVEEQVAEARRIVQRQKGLIVRSRAAGVNTLDAQRILWLLESNLRRFEEHRDRLRASVQQ